MAKFNRASGIEDLLALDGEVLDLPQERLGHDEGDVLAFHRSTFLYGCCREGICPRKQV